MTPGFEVGRSYFCRSPADYESIIEAKILRRTARTVIADVGGWRGKRRFKIHTFDDGIEYICPWGNFSMSPTIAASGAERPS